MSGACVFLTVPFTVSPQFAEAQQYFNMTESLQSVAERAVRQHHDQLIAHYHTHLEHEAGKQA